MSAPRQPPAFASLPPPPTTYSYPGGKWWRVDFHTHTPHSDDYGNAAGPARDEVRAITHEQWLLKQMGWGLDAVVVSDHNGGAWIDGLKEAYARLEVLGDAGFRPLVIFLGVEISTNNGVHLLAVFDPTEGSGKIDALLGAVGYRGTRGASDAVTTLSFEQCVVAIRAEDGLAIAAHVDEPKGLLHGSAGLSPTMAQALDAGIDSIEVRDWAALPGTLRKDRRLARLARVSGSDSHRPDDIGRNGFSRVHMTHANIEGLRTAFADGSPADGESWSVRPVAADDTTDFNRWPSQAIERITLTNLKFAGRVAPLAFPLHPRLNVLVGGRGSGKSTFVHALRLATARGREAEFPRFDDEGAPVSGSPAGDFWNWAKQPADRNDDGVIGATSKIDVFFRAPAGPSSLHWDTALLGNGANTAAPVVRREDGSDAGAYSPDRFPLSLYSQKQVLELCRRPAGLLGIIDRAQRVPELRRAFDQAVDAFKATRAKIRELQSRLVTKAQDEARLKDVTLELQKVQSEAVKQHQLRQAQARALRPDLGANSDLLINARTLRDAALRLGLPDLPASVTTEADPETQVAIQAYRVCQAEVEGLAQQIRTAAEAIRPKLEALDVALRGTPWWSKCEEARVAYEQLLGSGTTAINPARMATLSQERAQLEAKIARHKALGEEIVRHEAEATAQLEAVKTARLAISTSREEFVAAHNAKDTLLRMKLVRQGAELDEVERSFRAAIGVEDGRFENAISASEQGRENALLKNFETEPDRATATNRVKLRLLELIDGASSPTGFGDLLNNLRRQLASNPSRREAIETWFPEDRLELEYRREGAATWTSISQGSIGQQAAAMLSFLLSFGDEPLVLDQPEDDLDNRMIMSLVVEQVRKMKAQRQIVIVTHNPNIVVHGDAELVHAMEVHFGQVRRLDDASGGLQEEATRRFICDVMEGGADAFRKRFERMSAEDSHV